jgi:hypothetical protein
MLQQRQVNDIQQLIEVSFGIAIAPGAISTGTSLQVSVPAVIGGIYGTAKATFALGDELVVAPIGNLNLSGIQLTALPTTTPGTLLLTFFNTNVGTTTPFLGNYIIVATRYTPTVL